ISETERVFADMFYCPKCTAHEGEGKEKTEEEDGERKKKDWSILPFSFCSICFPRTVGPHKRQRKRLPRLDSWLAGLESENDDLFGAESAHVPLEAAAGAAAQCGGIAGHRSSH